MNERGYGPSRTHEVPVPLPAPDDATAVATAAVRRLRLELGPTTTVWGDGGCHGRGLCDVEVGSCRCFAGFAGLDCEVEVNECSSTSCLNGGACTDRAGSYSCSCGADWGGRDCERWVTLQATVKLGLDFATVGDEGTLSRLEFEVAFTNQLAELLGVVLERVVVDGISSGSVLVAFSVRADAARVPFPTAALRGALSAPGVTIAGGAVLEVAVTRQPDAEAEVAVEWSDSGSASGSWAPEPEPEPEPEPKPEPEPAYSVEDGVVILGGG